MHSELDIGEDVASPYFWSRGIARLDAVAVTHAPADHIGGVGAILANVLGIPVFPHKTGDTFELGGAKVRILAPEPDPGSGVQRPNEESLVMKITYGETSAVLEGDAERQTERQIAGEQPQADLLKVTTAVRRLPSRSYWLRCTQSSR
jgi:competence protein ComEC